METAELIEEEVTTEEMNTVSNEELLNQEKQSLYKLLEKKESWIKRNRIYYYSPLEHQKKFHASKAHIRLASGSNRSGKTTAGVIDDIAAAIGFKPWELPVEFKDKPISYWMLNTHLVPQGLTMPQKTPIKILIVEDDWDTADDILLSGNSDRAGALKYYLPEDAIAVGGWEKNAMGYNYQVTLKNGSVIRIDTEKSFINDPNSFEGGRWDRIHFDEPKKRELRVALKRGLSDNYGYELFTLTPLSEAWIKDEIYDKSKEGSDTESFFFDTKNNPHISAEGWQSFIESLDEVEKEARIMGKWVHLKGLVYPEFSAKMFSEGGHLIEPPSMEWIAENASVYLMIDPHSRQPQTAVFMLADNRGRWLVWDEIFLKCLIPDFCKMIQDKLSYIDAKGVARRLPVETAVIDPIAFNQDPVDGSNWAQAFIDNGINVLPASKQREFATVQTRKAIKDRKLLFSNKCSRTVWEIQHYVYDEWKNKGTRNEKERPVDKDDHCMECLGRGVVMEPVYRKPFESKPIYAEDCP